MSRIPRMSRMSDVPSEPSECLFYDYCNSFAGVARYWRIDEGHYAFEYIGKIYVCTHTQTPSEFKKVALVMPESTFALWLQYVPSDPCISKTPLILGIFNKNKK